MPLTKNNSARDIRKRWKGGFIEDEPDQDWKVSGRIHKYRVEPVLFAVRESPVAHELPGACAVSVNFDNGFTIDGNLPPGIEDNAIGVIRDLEYILLTHLLYLFYRMKYINLTISPQPKRWWRGGIRT